MPLRAAPTHASGDSAVPVALFGARADPRGSVATAVGAAAGARTRLNRPPAEPGARAPPTPGVSPPPAGRCMERFTTRQTPGSFDHRRAGNTLRQIQHNGRHTHTSVGKGYPTRTIQTGNRGRWSRSKGRVNFNAIGMTAQGRSGQGAQADQRKFSVQGDGNPTSSRSRDHGQVEAMYKPWKSLAASRRFWEERRTWTSAGGTGEAEEVSIQRPISRKRWPG